MADAFSYVALSSRTTGRFPAFSKNWESFGSTPEGGSWHFSHPLGEDFRKELRFRSEIDKHFGRMDNPEYSWMDADLDGKTGTLFVRTDFSSSLPTFIWNDRDVAIIATSLPVLTGLMRRLEIPVEFDASSGYSFLVSNFTPAGSTLLKGVKRLPANSDVRVSITETVSFEVSVRPSLRIFRPEFDPDVDAVENHLRIFDRTMKDVADYSSTKGPLGVMFTGGLDSSLILGWLSKNGVTDSVIPVTAVTGEWISKDDLSAPEIARSLGFRHETIRLESSGWQKALSDNLVAIGDATEAYGYSITLAGIHDAFSDIPVFVNGSGTDSPIASTHTTLSVLWEWWFGSGKPGFHDMTKSFRPFMSDGTSVISNLEQSVPDVENFISDFSRTFGQIMNFTGLMPEYFLGERPVFIPFSDKYGLKGSDPKAFELLTALDMSGIPHRMADAYLGISRSRSKENFSPFSSSSVRGSAFAFPVRDKFDPRTYPATVRDNQFFMKTVFSNFLPDILRTRTKTHGSLPNVRFWLTGRDRYEEVSILLFSFSKRGLVSEGYLVPMYSFYEKYCRAKESGLVEKPETLRKVTLMLSMIWRICALESFLQKFVDTKLR